MRPALLALAVLLVCASAPAWACPTCLTGNPALTTLGADPLFQNRVRLASSFRGWSQDDGTAGLDAQRVRELRLDLTASWAFHPRASLALTVPLQARELTTVSLATERGFGLGEVELTGRFIALAEDARLPRYLVSLVAGARLPTALTLSDAQGQPLSLDAQLGYGAVVPLVGLAYGGFFGDRWSALASATVELPLTGRFGARAGVTGAFTAAGQFQPWPFLGLRAGLEGRLEGVGEVAGVPDTARSGFWLAAAPDVLWSPLPVLVVLAGVRVPVVNALGGARPGLSGHLSVLVDL